MFGRSLASLALLATTLGVIVTAGIEATTTSPAAASATTITWSSTPSCTAWVSSAVPGAASVTVTMYGGGGGGQNGTDSTKRFGGGGGEVTATFADNPGGTLWVITGCGGGAATGNTATAGGGGYATGGNGGDSTDNKTYSGAGGGASALCFQPASGGSADCGTGDTVLAVAGGGGGAGDDDGQESASGGAAGNVAGTTVAGSYEEESGTKGLSNGGGSDCGGGGGGTTTGGAGGTESSYGNTGFAGSGPPAGTGTGGAGSGSHGSGNVSGGGGGAGYAGGGGGGGDQQNSGGNGCGGGGGSSYVSLASPFSGTSIAFAAQSTTADNCTKGTGSSGAGSACTTAANGEGGAAQYPGGAGAVTSATYTTLAATQLVFSTQPGGSVAEGTAFTQPTVSLEDANGEVETADSSDTVTLSASGGVFTPSNGGSAGSVTGCGADPKTLVAGVATFAGCAITGSGGNAGTYTLKATTTAGSFSLVSTGVVTVTPAAASQLVYSTQPGGSVAEGTAFTQPVVAIKDQYGNVETTDNTDTVTLSASGGVFTPSNGGSAGSVTGCGSDPKTAVAGVATFAGCAITGSGGNAGTYTLKATTTAGSFSLVSTGVVTITPAAASQLLFNPAPSNGTAGSSLPSFSVSVEDAFGNIETTGNTGATDSVTLSVVSGTCVITSGTNPVAASNGTATFSNIVSDTAGSCALKAADSTHGGVSPVTSSNFTVAPAAESKLIYNPTPSNGTAGSPLPSFGVSVEDSFGNIETTGNTGATDAVTLSVASGTCALSSGTNPVSATGGTATFSNIVSDTAGSCSLKATDTGDPSLSTDSVTSSSFTVAPAAESVLSIGTSPVSGLSGSGNTLGPITVVDKDAYGNLSPATGSGTVLTLSSSSAGGRFAANSGGSNTTTVTIANGQSQVSFYYGDTTAGTPTLTVAGSGQTSANQQEIVTNTVSVTNPGTQANVSGSAITALVISATDSSSTATLSYSASGLPAGLSINSSSGVISGTPTTACACSATVTVTDNASYSGSATFTWSITNTVAVTNPGPQANVSGSAITELDISASDSSSTATLSYSDSGTLPVGLSIDPVTGAIDGTPSTACACAVTITATDNASYSGQASFTWNITNTVSVTNPGDQSSVSGSAITELDNSATDSSSVATIASWSASGLPTGLSVNVSTGAIDGTPTSAGSYPVTLSATDSAGFTGSADFNWTITNTVSVTNPGDQADVSGTPISTLQIEASDTSPTATLSYEATGLPAGLSIDATTGAITGTPTTAGDPTVTVVVDDNANYGGLVRFTWTITNVVAVTNPGDQSSLTGGPISELDISATDSSSTATLSYADNSTLPPGLSIDPSTGAITGTPGTDGSYAVTITVTDSASYVATASFTWTIATAPAITSSDSTSFADGVASDFSVTATGSPTPALSESGTLPDGVSFSDLGGGAGSLSGTPAPGTAGTYLITLSASSSAGTATQDFTLSVAAASSSSSLTSSVNPSGYQKPVTLTDAVSGNSALGSPTGSVTFTDVTGGGDTVVCPAVALSPASSTTASATCSYSPPTSNNEGGTFQVVATYSGDGSYAASTSNTYTQSVGGELNTLVTLTPSANPTAYATTVTLTASVYDPAHKGTPSGTITFYDLTDDATICDAVTLAPTAPYTSGATCSFTPPAVNNTGGVFSLEDAYSGSTMYGYSNDHQSLTELGNNTPTLNPPTASANPVILGAAVVVSDTVSGSAGTPTGKLTFSLNGGAAPCSTGTDAQTITSGVATCKFTPATTGSYSIVANYSGDPNYVPGGPSSALSFQVDGSTKTTAATPVLTSANPGTAGQAVSVSDTVTASSGPAPSGTVTFTATISGSASVACAGATLDAGVVTCSFTPFGGTTGGSVSITATYQGSDADAPSKASTALAVSVLGTNTLSTFSLSSSANPQASNKAVVISAAVAGTDGTPSAMVTFSDGANLISSCGTAGAVRVISGVARCSYTPVGPGTHTLTASYAGDAGYAPQSTPVALAQLVAGTTATSATLSSSANPNAFGSAVTLTVTLSGSPSPSGTVNFSAKVGATTTVICANAAVTSGSATCSYDPTLPGPAGQSAGLTASYSGDATYAMASPTALTQIEAGTGTIGTFTLTASPSPAASGKAVALSAAISASPTAPSGTVSFYDNGSLITSCGTAGNVKITAGAAHCTYVPSGSGSHAIVAVYSGDVNYAPITQSTAGYSNSVTETVE